MEQWRYSQQPACSSSSTYSVTLPCQRMHRHCLSNGYRTVHISRSYHYGSNAFPWLCTNWNCNNGRQWWYTGPGYTYSWSTVPVQILLQPGETFSWNLYSNNNRFKGCTGTASVTIAEPKELDGSIISQTDINCFGLTTGSVTVAERKYNAYTYNLNGGAYQSSGTFSSLGANNLM
jgi:hypothetical protein